MCWKPYLFSTKNVICGAVQYADLPPLPVWLACLLPVNTFSDVRKHISWSSPQSCSTHAIRILLLRDTPMWANYYALVSITVFTSSKTGLDSKVCDIWVNADERWGLLMFILFHIKKAEGQCLNIDFLLLEVPPKCSNVKLPYFLR